MRHLPAFPRSALAASLLSSLALAAPAPQDTTAPFLEHDNVEGAHVRMATFPIRPMTFDGAGNLWIVNHHANRLERFDAGSTGQSIAPTGSYPMPADPVSVAFWAGPSTAATDDEIIVVCRGTWAIVRFDVTTQRVKSLLQLRPSDLVPDGSGGTVTARLGMMAEPGDVLVDAEPPAGTNPQAYVSCSGGDSVLQIDLVLDQIVRVFHRNFDAAFLGKHPLFLSFEPGAPGVRRKVLVAPLLSGNNTTWDGGLASGTRVVDLFAEAVNDNRLPDADLFRITPFVVNIDGQDGAVEIVARRTGTILFAHGVNESQGVLWQLNTDARNAGEANQSEPAVKGRFSLDRITTVPLPFAPSATPGIPNPSTNVLRYLDPVAMTGTQPAVLPRQTVGQPFALAFDSYGQGLITGLLTDNVMILSPTGVPRIEWQIPVSSGRAIPRGLLLRNTTSADEGNVLVYCWGDNKVREHHYNIAAGTAPVVNTFQPTADLTPSELQNGRALFFSAANSQFQNLSCATCHVEGGSDMLVWNLSNRPALPVPGTTPTDYVEIDSKGGMVTQSLVGIERLGPFHWRGEREFEDFNKAFDGLLGKPPSTQPGIPEADFKTLKAYLFSLTSPANPYEHRERILDDSTDFPGQPEAGKATIGQLKFHEQELFKGGFRCIDCHGARTGTVNEINREIASVSTPLRNRLKPAPFTELWRKLQPSFQVKFLTNTPTGPTTSGKRALLGAGLTHTGTFFDLADFASAIVIGEELDVADVVSFVFQFDSGIAPAVHAALVLKAANAYQMAGELNYLVVQAERRGCDLLAFHTPAGLPQGEFARWFYRRDTDRFVSDRGFADRTPAEFVAAAQAPLNEVTTFFAVPVGSGRRVALDFDLDNELNYAGDSDPLVVSTTPDTTPPTFLAGPTVEWVTARVARVSFETSEPTTATLWYRPTIAPGATATPVEDPFYGATHSMLVTQLRPSTRFGDLNLPDIDTTYDVWVEIRDRNPATLAVPSATIPLTTQAFIAPFGGEPSAFSPATNPNHRRIHKELVVGDLDVDAVLGATTVDATVQIVVSEKRGGSFDSGGAFQMQLASRVMVIGHVLGRRTSTDEFRDMTAIDPGAGDDYIKCSSVVQQGDPTPLALEIDGASATAAFVATSTPIVGGTGSFTVHLPRTVGAFSLNANDEIHFVVDAVVEIPPNVTPYVLSGTQLQLNTPWWPLPTFDDGQGGFVQWDFPSSGEAGGTAHDKL